MSASSLGEKDDIKNEKKNEENKIIPSNNNDNDNFSISSVEKKDNNANSSNPEDNNKSNENNMINNQNENIIVFSVNNNQEYHNSEHHEINIYSQTNPHTSGNNPEIEEDVNGTNIVLNENEYNDMSYLFRFFEGRSDSPLSAEDIQNIKNLESNQ